MPIHLQVLSLLGRVRARSRTGRPESFFCPIWEKVFSDREKTGESSLHSG